MFKQFYYLLLFLVSTQVVTAQDSTLSTWIHNPTRTIEIRYQTLKADSAIYQGSYQMFSDGKPQIIGAYSNNLKHGEWRRLYPSGAINMRAHYSQGYRHGTWTFFYPDGQLASTMSFNFDYPTGHWKGYYENGNLAKEVVYAIDSVMDHEIYYHDNGVKAREVYYSYGATTIYQVERKYYRDSTLFTASYRKNGVLDSVFKKYHSNGTLWEELAYKDGALQAVKANNSESGTGVDAGTFSNGNGVLNQYHSIGELYSTTTYKSGIREGTVSYNDEKKIVWQGQYKNNLRDGVWSHFNEKKKMDQTFTYFEGKDSVYVEKFFGKDLRIASHYYVNGLIHGLSVGYDFAGDTLRTTSYQFGVKHGTATTYKRGRLFEKGDYQSGEKVGDWNVFSGAGKVVDTEKFVSQATHTAGSFKQQVLFEAPKIIDDYGYKAVRIAGDFYGGSYAEERYIINHLLYPKWAEEKLIHGEVLVEISLSELGEVVDVKVIRGIGYHCDEEAIAVISAVPFWEPELLNGLPVPTKLLRTITF